MFASKLRKDVTLKVTDPDIVAFLGGDEVVVTIAKLSGTSLEKARTARTIAQAAPLRAYGADLLRGLHSSEIDAAAKALAAKKDLAARKKARYDDYDREEVVVAGVIRWSCEDKVKFSREAVRDLDEQVLQQLHEAILDYGLPALEEVEAEQGKS